MKIKDFLNKKVDLKDFLSVLFPFSYFFQKKKANETGFMGNIVQVPTETVRLTVKKDISSFVNLYGSNIKTGITDEMLKKALVNDLVESIVNSGAIEFRRGGDQGTASYFSQTGKQYLEAEILVVKKKSY